MANEFLRRGLQDPPEPPSFKDGDVIYLTPNLGAGRFFSTPQDMCKWKVVLSKVEAFSVCKHENQKNQVFEDKNVVASVCLQCGKKIMSTVIWSEDKRV